MDYNELNVPEPAAFEVSVSDGFSVTQQIDHNNGKKCYILNPFQDCNVQPNTIIEQPLPKNPRSTPPRFQSDCPSLVVTSSTVMFQNLAVLPGDKYYCQICDRFYKTNTTMMTHVRARHLKHSSTCSHPGCGFVSMTKYEKKIHDKVHEKEKKEQISKSKKRSNRILPVPCEEELKNEILKNNKNIPGMVKSIDTPIKGKVKYTCMECSHVFTNTYHAARHKEVHQQKPRRCYYCGDIRRGDMDLHVHYVRKHKNEGFRTYTCRGCQSGFSSLKMFEEHVHSPFRTLDCRADNMQQDYFYGQVPDNIHLDPVTEKRVNFLNRKHRKREAEQPLSIPNESEKQPRMSENVTPFENLVNMEDSQQPRSSNPPEIVDVYDDNFYYMKPPYNLSDQQSFHFPSPDPSMYNQWQYDQPSSSPQWNDLYISENTQNLNQVNAFPEDVSLIDHLADTERLAPDFRQKFEDYMQLTDSSLNNEISEEVFRLPISESFIQN